MGSIVSKLEGKTIPVDPGAQRLERRVLYALAMGNELDLDALCRKDPDERLSLHAGKVIAGSYLVDGDPARASDYNAYERPSKRKKRG